jgi:hypothetical protein
MKKITVILSALSFLFLISCSNTCEKTEASKCPSEQKETVDVKEEIKEVTEELVDETGEIDIDKLEEMANDK